MGGLAFLMFLVESLTGLLLLFHYVPSANGAYGSVQDITSVVPYGFFVRNLHYWAGQAMVVLVCLHMIRVFVTRSYAKPRRFNWLIGLGLLVSIVFVDFTGYLLVWDDRALWAMTIARNLAQEIPGAGPFVASAMFGPGEVVDLGLVRIYVWHAILWPTIASVLMAWHFWRIRKDGGISTNL
jgi:quinol-cytochrome oxidoreductase complex cytochrome b subunit